MPPTRPPDPQPPVCKNLNESYVVFYFSMGAVLVILSFFWTDNDLVCAPPPPSGMSPFFQNDTYAHTFANNSKSTRTISQDKNLLEIVTNMTIMNLK